MSKLQQLVNVLKEGADAPNPKLVDEAGAELEILVTALKKWRGGNATQGNTILRFVRVLDR